MWCLLIYPVERQISRFGNTVFMNEVKRSHITLAHFAGGAETNISCIAFEDPATDIIGMAFH